MIVLDDANVLSVEEMGSQETRRGDALGGSQNWSEMLFRP
jgi:hypothetical protein